MQAFGGYRSRLKKSKGNHHNFLTGMQYAVTVLDPSMCGAGRIGGDRRRESRIGITHDVTKEMNVQRDNLRYVLGAATLAGMALLVVLAFGRVTPPVTASAASEDMAALQAENAQLQQTIRQMQRRETQYRSEIETANETILNLMTPSGMASDDTQDGFLQPLADDDLEFDEGQFRDPRVFGNGRMAERHGFGESQPFFGETTRGF